VRSGEIVGAAANGGSCRENLDLLWVLAPGALAPSI
jgi:hypothetical protein